jgi:serine/threonine-protein kinase
MRPCPQCNTPYPDDAKVCPRDGAVLGDPAPSGVAAPTTHGRRGSGRVSTGGSRNPSAARGSATPRPERDRAATPGPAVAAALASTVASGERKPDDDEALLGRVLGSYRLLAVIGRGGMGRVYLAEHVKLGRKVALKLLKAEYAARRDSVARFFQEARAVNTIRHQNIVDITDFVELGDGTTFIIMELLAGANLGELVRREGPLPPHRATAIMIQVCDALEAAHRVGIVHRDLKPDNIFVLDTEGARDAVKLLDFGVAKLLSTPTDGEAALQTVEGSVVGTPAYMSPEQAAGTPIDHRSDIYSLGAIMYELFTGRRVFEARSFGEFVLKHVNAIPVPPRDLEGLGPLPAGIEPIILSCLEKRPEHRYQTAAALRTDLARVLAGEKTAALTLPPRPGAARARLIWIAAAGLAGLIVAGSAVLLLLPPVPPARTARTATPVVARADAAPARPEARLEFTFRSDPPGAQIFAAGERTALGVTPLRHLRPSNDRERAFVFRLPGYRDQRVQPSGQAAPEVFALLEPEAPAVPKATPRKGSAKATAHKAAPTRPRSDKPAADKPVADKPVADKPAAGDRNDKPIDRAKTVDPFDKK